jgi:chromosomal replication initiation ATPase DnaA
MPDPRQLPLALPVEPRYGAEDFLVGASNEAAYALIERWPDWPDRIVRLVGPEGCGKTHLAAIWVGKAHAWTLEGFEIDQSRIDHIASAGALVIEDCDRGGLDEAALFHLLNALRARQAYAILTARTGPEAWGLKTPDLLSRLRQAPAIQIEAPDDGLFKAVLVKLFIDRQLVVDTAVVDYLAVRIERSLTAAEAIVAALDAEALSRGRRITRPMAADLLGQAENT